MPTDRPSYSHKEPKSHVLSIFKLAISKLIIKLITTTLLIYQHSATKRAMTMTMTKSTIIRYFLAQRNRIKSPQVEQQLDHEEIRWILSRRDWTFPVPGSIAKIIYKKKKKKKTLTATCSAVRQVLRHGRREASSTPIFSLKKHLANIA